MNFTDWLDSLGPKTIHLKVLYSQLPQFCDELNLGRFYYERIRIQSLNGWIFTSGAAQITLSRKRSRWGVTGLNASMTKGRKIVDFSDYLDRKSVTNLLFEE